MRVIAGTLKGRRLAAPTWTGVRPTSDRLRETLFNILGPRIAGARVLDGFAGTGALGIEAASRGAASVTFVERDRRAAALVAANVRRCGLESRCAIIRADLEEVGRRADLAGLFEVVLLDPPYAAATLGPILGAAAGLLATGGVLVLEHARRRDVPAAVAGLERVREVRAGDSALAVYQRPPA
jgi:16S rRNA (guanine(966)-N(2))-methyltransferase RsmD